MKLKMRIMLPITIIVIMLIISLNINHAFASSGQFKLITYNYKSSSGSQYIYPGSRNVQLIIEVQYTGNNNLTGVTGCLIIPSAFTFSRGSQSCSSPYMPNGTTYSIIKPGDIMTFKYNIDVLENIQPGTYMLMLNITYRFVNETSSFNFEVISGIEVKVNSFPPISLIIINWYWNPNAYPGSEGVSLNIVLENNGNSTIVNGNAIIEFPSIIKPNKVNVNIGTINVNDKTTIIISNLDISPNAIPNINYQVTLRINVTARTGDGVDYMDSIIITFNVTLMPPPIINLKIIDYGITAPNNVNNLKYTRIYVQFQVMDTRSISAITAIFNITSENIFFINGSKISISTISGNYGYGDYITIESDEILINNKCKLINVILSLTIFGSDDGAEFWSNQKYNLTINFIEPKINVYIVDSYWSNQNVYPGSNSESINIIIENFDSANLRDIVATLILPSNIFYPSIIKNSNININSGSRTTITFQNININSSAKPGTYIAKLILNGIAWQNDNSFYNVSINFSIPIIISDPKFKIFELIDYGWNSGVAYTSSCNIYAYATLRIKAQATTSNIIVRAYPSPQIKLINNRMHQLINVQGSYGYGETFKFNIGPLNVTANNPSISSIVFIVEALVNIHGSEFWVNETFNIPLKIDYPKLNLTIIDCGWYEGYASNESYGVTAYITLQSFHIDEINVLKVTLKLNTSNALFETGKSESLWIREERLSYGEVVTATFSGINIKTNTSVIPAIITIEALVSQNNGYYRAYKTFKVNLNLISDESLLLIELSSIYRGNYAPILPSANGITIRLEFINIKPDAISSVDVNVNLPSKFRLKGIEGSIFNGVPGGTTCNLDLILDIDQSVGPGIYEAKITLNYFKRINNALIKFTQTINVNIPVESISNYLSEVKLVSWYWGINRPITVFENERNVPLTLILMNEGRYPVDGVTVEIKSLSPNVKLITDSSYCIARLESGANCRATLYVDLANVGPCTISFKVIVKYIFSEFGTHINAEKSFQISLKVMSFAAGKGLKLIDYGWRNDWPVYPNTKNAIFTVTLANKWPYSISGLEFKLKLPNKFKSKFDDYAISYISGPIDSLATVSAEFIIDVGNVTPSNYKAKLIAEYIVECGGAQIKVKQEFNLNINVNDLEEAIQLISSSWYGISPEPGTYGAYLMVLIRNNYVKEIRGPVLEIYLPKGFTCSINNDTIAYIPPYTQTLITTGLSQAASQQSLIDQLTALMFRYMMGGSREIRATISEGDIITYIIPLNIHVNRTGIYFANAILNFIDHWDNVRRINFTLPINVYGSTRMIEVYLPKSIRIINGSAILQLYLSNTGYSSIYDTYIILVPQAPILIPIQNVKYINRIDPNKNVSLTFNLIYNPTSIMTGMGGAMLHYTSLPLLIAIRFKDVLGYQHIFNVSAAILIEPFIDLRLGSDVKAELRGYNLIVSGTIINYGLSIARSTEVKVKFENISSSSFIGDIDPASQSAFRIEYPVKKELDRVIIELWYQDDYGRIHKRTYQLPVFKVKLKTPAEEAPKQPIIIFNYQWIIAIVSAFLAISLILIYRYLKKHERILSEEVISEI